MLERDQDAFYTELFNRELATERDNVFQFEESTLSTGSVVYQSGYTFTIRLSSITPGVDGADESADA